MSIYSNSFEGGTNGTYITNANSGGLSGNAFTYVPANMIAYSSVQKSHGSLSAYITNAGANYASVQWSQAGTDILARGYFYFVDTIPTVGSNILYISGDGNALLVFQSGGRLQLYAAGANRGTTTTGLSPNTWYRIEFLRTSATVRFAVYLGEDTTAVYDSGLTTGLALGNLTNVIFGKVDSVNDTTSRYIDSIGIKTNADAVWGAWTAANTAPTAHAGGHQLVTPGSTVQLDGSASSDPDAGTTLSYVWSFLWPASGAPALSSSTAVSPTFTAGSAGAVYTLQLLVSDGASTNTSTVNIAVSTSAASNAASELVWTGSAWE